MSLIDLPLLYLFHLYIFSGNRYTPFIESSQQRVSKNLWKIRFLIFFLKQNQGSATKKNWSLSEKFKMIMLASDTYFPGVGAHVYFQFIYRWQILFQLTIRLAFHKQQGLSQTSIAINNIAECWYRWHHTFEAESQFVVLIKVNINQNRNGKRR